MQSTRVSLNNLLSMYQTMAKCDASRLHDLIPAKEIWRFFIDGEKQSIGRQLKNHELFKTILSSLELMNLTVGDYIEKHDPEGPSIQSLFDNPLGRSRSILLALLNDANCPLEKSDYSRFKLIDLITLDNGWIPFERAEKGYLRALANAYDLLFQSTELSIEFIKALHQTALTSVQKTQYFMKDIPVTGNVREDSEFFVTFSLHQGNTSEKGLSQFFTSQPEVYLSSNILSQTDARFIYKEITYSVALLLEPSAILSITQKLDSTTQYSSFRLLQLFGNCFFNRRTHQPVQIDDLTSSDALFLEGLSKVNTKEALASYLYKTVIAQGKDLIYRSQLIEENLENALINNLVSYFSKITHESNPLFKLEIIIDFIQQCEQLHPFLDGNCRTFAMLLLNFLLLKNGFPLAILDNPNRFDMYGNEELLNDVLKGMENTITLIQTGSLYNIKTDDIIQQLKMNENFSAEFDYIQTIITTQEKARCMVTENQMMKR